MNKKNNINNSKGVIIGDNNTQNININKKNNHTKYKGEKENNIIYEYLAPILMKKLGKNKIILIGTISLVLFLFGFFSYLNGVSSIKLISYLPSLNYNWMIYFLIITFIIAVIFLGSLYFFNITQCKKCLNSFAYEEYKLPDVDEIKLHDGHKIITIRYYKCKYCGNEKTENFDEFISNEKKN